MGWVEYIIIKRLNLIIEVPRGFSDGLPEYKKTVLDRLIDEDERELIELDDIRAKDITVGDIKKFAKAVDFCNETVGCFEYDHFFVYWLIKRGIEYRIISELDKEWEMFDKTGYVIIER